MIIKFKTRKNIYSAKQLVHYILTDKGRIQNPFEAPIILQNINRLSLETMHQDFLDNHKYLKKRKGGVAFYHEIIAISKKDREYITLPMLEELMRSYIKMRGGENALVIAKVHDMQHIHLMMSANEVRSQKRLRMSKNQMQDLLLNYERRHIKLYPELKNSIAHTNKLERQRRDIQKEQQNHRREKEYQMKQRSNQPTQKEIILERLNQIFNTTSSKEALIQEIQKIKEFKVYIYRGKLKGIIFNDKKTYRFSTLGIPNEKIQKLEKIQSRLEELQLIKKIQTRQRAVRRSREDR